MDLVFWFCFFHFFIIFSCFFLVSTHVLSVLLVLELFMISVFMFWGLRFVYMGPMFEGSFLVIVFMSGCEASVGLGLLVLCCRFKSVLLFRYFSLLRC
nr:NADH dehydrogenase subunit 4L [Rhabdopleura sp. NHMO H2137]